MKLIHKTGWLLIAIITLIPSIRWMQLKEADDFEDFSSVAVALGELTGIIAICFYAINFILSTRLKIFDVMFGGLNRAYIAHHVLGGVALIVMLVHPLLLAMRNVPDEMQDAAMSLLPTFGASADWPVNFGIFSLVLTTALIYITFYIKIPYEKWLNTHRLLGLAFLLSGLHVYLIRSDTSQDTFMRVYILTLIIVGLLAFVYRTLFGHVLVRRNIMTVNRVDLVNDMTTRIVLQTKYTGIPMDFEPGQFVFVRFKQAGIGYEYHPFSITSKPGAQELEIIVRSLGDFTSSLRNLSIGAEAEVEGAFGKFGKQVKPSADQIWIAGGIGLTPFLSLAKALDKDAKVELFYVVDTIADLVEYNELLQIAAGSEGRLQIYLYPTKLHDGFVSGQYIIDNSADHAKGKEILLCGPPMMMKSLRAQLRAYGIPNSKIHTEEFALL